jgi:hypothetical protein
VPVGGKRSDRSVPVPAPGLVPSAERRPGRRVRQVQVHTWSAGRGPFRGLVTTATPGSQPSPAARLSPRSWPAPASATVWRWARGVGEGSASSLPLSTRGASASEVRVGLTRRHA